jgi:hypothetical protein
MTTNATSGLELVEMRLYECANDFLAKPSQVNLHCYNMEQFECSEEFVYAASGSYEYAVDDSSVMPSSLDSSNGENEGYVDEDEDEFLSSTTTLPEDFEEYDDDDDGDGGGAYDNTEPGASDFKTSTVGSARGQETLVYRPVDEVDKTNCTNYTLASSSSAIGVVIVGGFDDLLFFSRFVSCLLFYRAISKKFCS